MLDKTVNYNPFTDFRMVSIFTKYEIIFMTGTASGIQSMKELAAQTDAFRTKIAQTGLSVQATGTAAEDQAEWRAESDRLDATLKRFDIRLPE